MSHDSPRFTLPHDPPPPRRENRGQAELLDGLVPGLADAHSPDMIRLALNYARHEVDLNDGSLLMPPQAVIANSKVLIEFQCPGCGRPRLARLGDGGGEYSCADCRRTQPIPVLPCAAYNLATEPALLPASVQLNQAEPTVEDLPEVITDG